MRITPLLFVAFAASQANAQLTILVTDREADSVWLMRDLDNNYVIDESTEVIRWFGPGNASGLPGVLNPNTIGCVTNAGGHFNALIGDQDSTARKMYWTIDFNDDGDAMDAGEAGVFGDITTGAGQSFAFPTGVAYDSNNIAYVTNAGNGFGPDAIWRCPDNNADHDANDAGETTAHVTANGFSTSNGSYSPQEIAFGTDGALYLRNSSANLHGIYRLADADNNGIIDQTSEFTPWYVTGNASGFTMAAGFGIDRDPMRLRSMYYHSLGAGSADQIYRVTDVNNDGDAMDAGESVLAFSTTEANFTSIDVCALRDGSVLFTDNSSKRIIRLSDLDNDGLFTSAGERTTFFANSTSVLGDVRNAVVLQHIVCDSIDFNNDGSIFDPQDIDAFLSVYSEGPCIPETATCNDIDYNNDGSIFDPRDIDAFLSVFSEGPCF